MKLNIKKQTAVEWFIDNLKPLYPNIEEFKLIIGLAKDMEKEQNQNFYIEGRDFANYAHDEEYGGIEYWDREPMGFEQYYNETYNQ